MFSKLKTVWARLSAERATPEAVAEAVEYKGYRIRATPQLDGGQYRTAGSIEKDTPEGLKRHQFIRADTYAGASDAVAFTISKAKQIIDQQGDSIFT